MKRSRYTPEQIAFVLRQAVLDLPEVTVYRSMEIAELTCHPIGGRRAMSAWEWRR